MKRILLLAIFVFFASAFLITFRGHYGSDQFMSYLTAESIVLDHRLAIGVRDFNLPDIQGNMERAPTGIDGRRYTLFGLALLERWEKADRFPGRAALGLGLSLSLCLLTEVYAALIIVPAILIYVLLRLWRKQPGRRVIGRTLIGLTMPLLAITGILIWFYWLRFGGLAAPRLSGHLSFAFIPVAI